MTSEYEFIVVGAGAAGCVVASRLANAASKPSVLLLESGGANDSPVHLSASERFNVAFKPGLNLNWGYKTEPQIGGQRIDYSRGKGLGGSTAINFCAFVVNPAEDWDEWARRLEDDSFNWANARRHLDRIENLDTTLPASHMRKYVHAEPAAHSNSGLVDLTYGTSWRSDIEDAFLAAEQCGFGLNADTNSGDTIGFGMGALTIRDDLRVSASTAYLERSPPNLKILTDAHVARIILDDQVASGVELVGGTRYFASKEVVLCAGAINTPQVLMLSGVGPRDELQRHSVELRKHLPQLGANLQDHPYTPVAVALKRGHNTPMGNPPQAPTPMAFLRSDRSLSSDEFIKLPRTTQDFLAKDAVPSFELIAFAPPANVKYTPDPDTFVFAVRALLMNCQSRGTVRLQSADPMKAPAIDPRFMTHAYDRRVHIDGVRTAMRYLSAPIFANRTVSTIAPENDSDDAIWEWIQQNLHSTWHPSCTARMGRDSDEACVDKDFRVFGVDRLRVVDLSVCVFVPNTHTQSTAYIIGEIAAEKLVVQHGL